MAYADDLRAVTATYNQAADLIDGLLVGSQSAIADGLIGSTSPSYADMPSLSLSQTVKLGECVILVGLVTYSITTLGPVLFLGFHRDSTLIPGETAHGSPAASADGLLSTAVVFGVDAPSAGTYNYKLRWAIGGSGTVYSGLRRMWVLKVRGS